MEAVLLGACVLAMAGASNHVHAKDAKGRAHAVADIAKVDGSSVTWIQTGLNVTLPEGWTVDGDTGKKDTDLGLEDEKAHEYAQITSGDTTDFKAVCAKLCEGILSGGKGEEESKNKKVVAGCQGTQSVLSIVSGEHKLKYQITAFAKDNTTYAIMCFTSADQFDAASKHFDALVDSVKFGKSGGGGELAAVQGEWNVLSMSVDGKETPADSYKGMVMTVKGDAYKLVQGANEAESGTLKFGEENGTKTLDWHVESGSDKGKVQLSIYKLDGDALSFSASQPGKDERPKEMGTKAGQAYITLKKK